MKILLSWVLLSAAFSDSAPSIGEPDLRGWGPPNEAASVVRALRLPDLLSYDGDVFRLSSTPALAVGTT